MVEALTKTSPRSSYLLAITLCSSLFGYQILAPWFQLISPEGSAPAIIFRVVVLALCHVCALAYGRNTERFHLAALPLFLFLALYAIRLGDNFFVREFVWRAEPITAFSLLIGAAIVPALLLQRVALKIDDRSLVATMVPMAILFLVGLALNWDSLLVASQVYQASLEKLNPIGLGFIASSLTIFFIVAPIKGVFPVIGKYLLLALLIGVTIFSKSRGPLLATLFALFAYGLLTSGPRRKQLTRAFVFIVVGLGVTPFIVGMDLFILAFERFTTMGVSDSNKIDASSEERVVAWNAAWAQFADAPVFGNRVFETALMHYPHNLFLESLISLGVIGTCLLMVHLMICGYMVVRILRLSDTNLVERFIALIAIKEFVAVQVSGAIWGHTTFWIASACVIGISASRFYRRTASTDFVPAARWALR